jgi:hypothetical protein
VLHPVARRPVAAGPLSSQMRCPGSLSSSNGRSGATFLANDSGVSTTPGPGRPGGLGTPAGAPADAYFPRWCAACGALTRISSLLEPSRPPQIRQIVPPHRLVRTSSALARKMARGRVQRGRGEELGGRTRAAAASRPGRCRGPDRADRPVRELLAAGRGAVSGDPLGFVRPTLVSQGDTARGAR